MIKTSCSQCGKSFQLKDETAGKKAKCPDCGTIFKIESNHEDQDIIIIEKQAANKPLGKGMKTLVAVILFFSVLAFIGHFVEDKPSKIGDVVGAWSYSKRDITKQLKSPSTADFGWQSSDDCVEHLGGGRYRVVGWVDCQNGFGAKVRINFVQVLQYMGKGVGYTKVEQPLFKQR